VIPRLNAVRIKTQWELRIFSRILTKRNLNSDGQQFHNNLSPQIIEHKKDDKYTNGNSGLGLGQTAKCGGVTK